MDIVGKYVLITGGGKRIGREIALYFHKEGAKVIIQYSKSVNEARELEEIGIETIRFDFLEDVKKFVSKIKYKIDVLINNASIFEEDDFFSIDFEALVKSIKINSWTPLYIAREMKDSLKKVINILDTKILTYQKKHFSYNISKKILYHFTKYMALELAPIEVNAIAPGAILPPEGKDEEYLKKLVEKLPLKKIGGLKDIINAIDFLIKSDFVTGEVIFVDGGEHLFYG